MTCNKDSCCVVPRLLVDEYCQVINTTLLATFWASLSINSYLTTVTVALDSASSTSATVTLTPLNGTPIIYTLTPGESRTDSVNSLSTGTIAPVGVGTVLGKSCITQNTMVYTK